MSENASLSRSVLFGLAACCFAIAVGAGYMLWHVEQRGFYSGFLIVCFAISVVVGGGALSRARER